MLGMILTRMCDAHDVVQTTHWEVLLYFISGRQVKAISPMMRLRPSHSTRSNSTWKVELPR